MNEKYILEIRAFNRFYTDIIGILDKYILNSKYSLPEVRILYELYHHKSLTSTEIIASLHMDKGYMSRLLKHLEKKKLISKRRSREDGRTVYLELTSLGRKEFQILNQASNFQIHSMVKNLTVESCDELIQHMQRIKVILLKNDKNN